MSLSPGSLTSVASVVTAGLCSMFEKNGLIITGASPETALEPLRDPGRLLQRFAPDQAPLSALWKLHREIVAPRLLDRDPIYSGITTVFQDGFCDRSLSADTLITRYFGELGGLLGEGMKTFSGKASGWSWADVFELEDRLYFVDRLESSVRSGYHDRRDVLELAQAGFRERAVQACQMWIEEEIEMPQVADGDDWGVEVAECLREAGLGGSAVPLFRMLIPSAAQARRIPMLSYQRMIDAAAHAAMGASGAEIFHQFIALERHLSNGLVRCALLKTIVQSLPVAGLQGDLSLYHGLVEAVFSVHRDNIKEDNTVVHTMSVMGVVADIERALPHTARATPLLIQIAKLLMVCSMGTREDRALLRRIKQRARRMPRFEDKVIMDIYLTGVYSKAGREQKTVDSFERLIRALSTHNPSGIRVSKIYPDAVQALIEAVGISRIYDAKAIRLMERIAEM